MKNKSFLMILLILIFSISNFASSIKKITLSELQGNADLIVMAEVIKLVEKGDQDIVTIKVDSYLKGNSKKIVYTFTLISRGGLKDFDPLLKKGDTGVFFLKLNESSEQIEKAYWGSIAVFPKNHYDLTKQRIDVKNTFTTETADSSQKINISKVLNFWKSHRIKNKQINNIKEYERGFRVGFTSKPGLVDGSSDFNLGHSDGMLAKINKSPQK